MPNRNNIKQKGLSCNNKKNKKDQKGKREKNKNSPKFEQVISRTFDDSLLPFVTLQQEPD